MVQLIRSFYRDENGQATIEYVLVLSVAVLGAITILRTLTVALQDGILRFGGRFEKNLKTGRAPLDVWIN